MDHSSPVTCLPRSGTSTITPAHQGIQGAMVKQKPLSRLSKDYSTVLSIQEKTPILPCWHIGARPLMPTFVHQQRCTLPQRICHKDPHAADDRDRLNQRATQSAEYHDRRCRPKSPLYAGQTVSVLNDARTLWLPAKVIRQAAHGSYLVQVIGGGQYRRARDHIRERHPDAVKDDTSTSPDVAPATPEALPALFAASPPAAPAASVAPTTPPQPVAPAATTNTPRKSPAVSS